MTASDDAVACFSQGFSCSQAMLSSFSQRFGMDRDTALKIAGPFGGGIAGTGNICGALTGAIMVIGLRYGRIDPEDQIVKEQCYAAVHSLLEEFGNRHGSVTCCGLLGHDVSTPEGKEQVKELGLGETLCPGFVREAADILESLIEV